MMFLMSAFDKDVVMRTLNILWQGLLSVFIVILVVFLVVVILNLISAKSAKYKEAHAGEIKKLEDELAVLAKDVPKDTLAKYTAKRKEKLFPVVCEVSSNRCPQCGMELSIAEQAKLSDGTFIECDSCRRILFKRK